MRDLQKLLLSFCLLSCVTANKEAEYQKCLEITLHFHSILLYLQNPTHSKLFPHDIFQHCYLPPTFLPFSSSAALNEIRTWALVEGYHRAETSPQTVIVPSVARFPCSNIISFNHMLCFIGMRI